MFSHLESWFDLIEYVGVHLSEKLQEFEEKRQRNKEVEEVSIY